MEHIPTPESDDQKVYRIAKELGISLEDAAITCAGFELAFSDHGMRGAIFEIVEQLDDEAYKKGEPLGMILSYAVELGMGGIHVTRHANEIPPGKVVSLTPTNRAMIFLKIKDNFATQQFLGPLIVNRPELPSSARQSTGRSYGQNEGWQTDVFCQADGVVYSDSEINNEFPSLDRRSTGQSYGQNEGWQADVFCRADGVVCSDGSVPRAVATGDFSSDGVVCPDSEMKKPAIPLGPSSLEPPRQPIRLGPIRLTWNDRFQFLSAAGTSSQLNGSRSPLVATVHSAPTRPLHALASSHPIQPTSGLSPPPPVGDHGHSASKAVPLPLAITVETMCLTSGSLKFNNSGTSVSGILLIKVETPAASEQRRRPDPAA
jgi:hypothetical protein